MKNILEPGDLEAALKAATAIGDDASRPRPKATSSPTRSPTAPPSSGFDIHLQVLGLVESQGGTGEGLRGQRSARLTIAVDAQESRRIVLVVGHEEPPTFE